MNKHIKPFLAGSIVVGIFALAGLVLWIGDEHGKVTLGQILPTALTCLAVVYTHYFKTEQDHKADPKKDDPQPQKDSE